VLRHRKSPRKRPLATLEIHAQAKKNPAGNKEWKRRAEIRNTERQMSCSGALGHACRGSLAHPAFGRKESSKAQGRRASQKTSNHKKLRFASGENKVQVGNGGRQRQDTGVETERCGLRPTKNTAQLRALLQKQQERMNTNFGAGPNTDSRTQTGEQKSQNETTVQIQMQHQKKSEEHKRDAEKIDFFIETQQKSIHSWMSLPSLPHLICRKKNELLAHV
jgi:hypothetical protein